MNTVTPQQPAPALPDCDPRSAVNIQRRQALRIAERDERGRLLPGSILERAGRPIGHSVQFMARQYTAEAIGCLAEIMDDEKAPQAARVSAATALLDRGWGKSPLQLDLNVRQKFDSFLRDIGIEAAYERDHPVVAEADE